LYDGPSDSTPPGSPGAGERPDPYDRRTAAFPATVTTADKYWPPVGRIDAAHGDKNLVCACPDINDYA
jgi:glycine dehydrogenase